MNQHFSTNTTSAKKAETNLLCYLSQHSNFTNQQVEQAIKSLILGTCHNDLKLLWLLADC